MAGTILLGLLLPFAGTALGAACVFVLRRNLRDGVQRALTGFAAGVMVAASVWSLLIPAMDQAAGLGAWAFLPAAGGFWLGVGFLLLLDHLIPHLHRDSDCPEGPRCALGRSAMLTLAVTRACWRKTRRSRPRARRRSRWASRSRISPKARSFRCRCTPRACPARGRLPAVRCPAPWNRQPRR